MSSCTFPNWSIVFVDAAVTCYPAVVKCEEVLSLASSVSVKSNDVHGRLLLTVALWVHQEDHTD